MLTPDLASNLAAFLAQHQEFRRREAKHDPVQDAAYRAEERFEALQARADRIRKKLISPQAHRTQDAAQPLALALRQAGAAGIVVGDRLVIDLHNTDHHEWTHTVAVIAMDKILGLAERLKP